MNFSNGRLSLLVALILFAGLSGHLFAGTFTVTSTDDPEFIDTSNCLSPNLACSLREALAAADLTSEPDVVVFKVDGPIHLTRMVTVANPVIIDGGGETIVRVHQGYEITTLEDRNDDPSTPGLCGELVCPELPVLQPTFFSVRGPNRPMLHWERVQEFQRQSDSRRGHPCDPGV
jgi:CSLREA domain-containing protein